MIPNISSKRVSWSKNGIIAYADSESSEGNLCISFLETINGVNWRFHPPQRYMIHPQLHETSIKTNAHESNSTVLSTASKNNDTNSVHTTNSNNTNNAGNSQSVNNKSTPTTTASTNIVNNYVNLNGKPSTGTANSSKFFYNISSVHWNNWFSLPGDMLAVCDEIGNMTMLIAGQSPEGATTFERLTMLFQDNIYKLYNHIMPLTPITDMSKHIEKKKTKKEYHTTILDFHWISSSKSVIISQFCALDTTTNIYRNKAQQIPPYGVFHPPSMKYACAAIRRNGQIDFWYQFSNSKDHKKITLQLSMSNSQQRNKELDWLQFANITPIDDGHCMLITTYSKLKEKLCFYKLYVSWNGSANRPLSDPNLRIQNILNVSLDRIDAKGNIITLSNLHVVTKTVSEKDHYPEIILVFDINGTKKSLIKRMRLINTYLAMDYISILNPNLPNENTNRLPVKTKRYNVRYYNDMVVDDKIINVSSEMLDSFISFYSETGNIASYNLNDWELETERMKHQVKQGKYTNIITSVLSAGFHYPKVPASFSLDWICVSPTISGVIYKLRKESTPQFHCVIKDDISNAENDSIDATAMAFTFVGSTHRQLSAEDLSIVCKNHITKLEQIKEERAINFIMTLMTSLYPFFNVSLNAPKEIMEKMITSRPIQKIMLFQLELGSRFRYNENIASMARIILYLKNVLFSFSGVARNLQFAIEQMNSAQAEGNQSKLFQTAFSKQDLIHSLIPVAKWFVKFITYLMQEVLVLVNNPPTEKGTLVLGVLGAKMSRQLLLSILTEIKRIAQVITKFPESTYPVLNESSNYLKMVLGESPINFEKFETFLININNKFTATNEGQNTNEIQSILNREHSLLIKAEVSPDDKKVAEFLVTYANNTLVSHLNAANVYFADTSGLRTSQEEYFVEDLRHLLQPIENGLVINSKAFNKKYNTSKLFSQLMYDGVTYDRLSEIELNDGKLKRCSRCGCVTRAGYVIAQDKTIISTSIQTKRWPTMYTRMCICSGLLYEL